jgi:hypothetical protein
LATRFATASVEWAVVGAFLAGGLGANIVASKLVHRLDQRRLNIHRRQCDGPNPNSGEVNTPRTPIARDLPRHPPTACY